MHSACTQHALSMHSACMQSEIRGNEASAAVDEVLTRSLGSEDDVGPDHESARIGSEHRRLARQLRAAVHVQRRDGIGLAVWSAPVGRGGAPW